MTPQEILDRARGGQLDDPGVVADAVRALVTSGDGASALELYARTWRLWLESGNVTDGMAIASLALDAANAPATGIWRTRALYADGRLAFRAGDMARSLARNQEVLRLARESDDVRGECDGLTGLARIALREGRYEDVVALARQGRERARTAGDRDAEELPLHLEAAGLRLQRDYPAARELYLESLGMAARSGNTYLVVTEQHNLGWVELHMGHIDEAEERFRMREAGAGLDAYTDAWSELNWAATAALRGRWDEAKERFARGSDALEKLGVVLDPDDAQELTWLRDLIAQRAC